MKLLITIAVLSLFTVVFAASPDIEQIKSGLSATYDQIESFTAKAEVFEYSG